MTSSKRFLIFLALFSFFATFYTQYPAIVDYYRVDDDVRHYFWMERFVDTSLFPNDHLLSHAKGVHEFRLWGLDLLVQYESWGFSLLYFLASYFVRPIVFNKILPFGLMLISVIYLFLLGRLLKDEITGFVASLIFIVLNLSSSPNTSVTAGLERSFSFPMLIIFVYYFVREAPVASTLILAFQSIFYFPIFVLSAATHAISLLVVRGRRLTFDLSSRRILPLVLGTGLGLVFFLPAMISAANATPPYSIDGPVWENPYYSHDGRIPIFWENLPLGLPLFVLTGYGGLATYQDIANMVPLLLILLLMFATMGRAGLQIPRTIKQFLFGTLSAWGLCWLVALLFNDFVLRYPFKYTQAALPLFLLIVVAYNIEPFAEALAHLWTQNKSRRGLLMTSMGIIVILIAALAFPPTDPRFLTRTYSSVRAIGIALGGMLFALGINQLARLRLKAPESMCAKEPVPRQARQTALVVVTLILILSYGLRMKRSAIEVTSPERQLYRTISNLPKDTLLAGDPSQMSNIPLFAHRSVLFSAEITSVDRARILDFYDAYYAESPESVDAFCQDYGVDYLVVNKNQFDPDYLAAGRFFFASYNSAIIEIVAKRSSFILPQTPDDRKLFQSDDLFLIPCAADVFR